MDGLHAMSPQVDAGLLKGNDEESIVWKGGYRTKVHLPRVTQTVELAGSNRGCREFLGKLDGQFLMDRMNVLQDPFASTLFAGSNQVLLAQRVACPHGLQEPSLPENVNRDKAVVAQEGWSGFDQHKIDIDGLDKVVHEAKHEKDKLLHEIEDIWLLRLKTENEEAAARQAKLEAESEGLEMEAQVAQMRQKVALERAEIEMRAAEICGEKAVLSSEARELHSRLLETQAQQSKALAVVNEIRSTLLARQEAAVKERDRAIEEKKNKQRSVQELLALEQAALENLNKDLKKLDTEMEACTKLRDLLIDRGNLVDMLQGEIAVISEDVAIYKKQMEDGVPLSKIHSPSASRSLISLQSRACTSRDSIKYRQSMMQEFSPSTAVLSDSGAKLTGASAWFDSMHGATSADTAGDLQETAYAMSLLQSRGLDFLSVDLNRCLDMNTTDSNCLNHSNFGSDWRGDAFDSFLVRTRECNPTWLNYY